MRTSTVRYMDIPFKNFATYFWFSRPKLDAPTLTEVGNSTASPISRTWVVRPNYYIDDVYVSPLIVFHNA